MGLTGFAKNLAMLIRPWQWYKNLIIFLPVIFSTLALNPYLVYLTFIGFVSMSLAASGNYAFNDIIDRDADRRHPEKKNRPVASGAIPIAVAAVIGIILYAAAFWIAFALSVNFLLFIIAFILFTFTYSLWLKKVALVDVLMISINFVLRTVGGLLILNATTTPWLIMCPFFLALFLAVGKRAGDERLLGKNGALHRKVLAYYTPAFTSGLLIIATSLLVISYTFYAFLSEHSVLLLPSLPFALYLVFYYFNLINSGSDIPRHPERALRDPHIVIGIVLWGAMTMLAIYGPLVFPLIVKAVS